MNDTFSQLLAALHSAVAGSSAVSPAQERGAAEARAAELGGRASATSTVVPEAVRQYVETVAQHADRVTDEDVAALKAKGLSEDAIFELTVAAAVGAGLGRYERGLAALRGAPSK